MGGNFDFVFKSLYFGFVGEFIIDDFWVGDVVIGFWMDCFICIFKGGLVFFSNFNGVFYVEEEVYSFFIWVGKYMFGGFGLVKGFNVKM